MEDPDLHDAFVELHGERLHGFALIVTLGDRELAGSLSAEALARGTERIDQLRHPERAAAWLRASVTDAASGPAWGHRRPSETERREALAALGVDPTTYDALASLDARSRAAIAAADVERFSAVDVSEMVGDDERVRRARRDYLDAYLAAAQDRGTPPPGGELTVRLQATAASLLSGAPLQ